MSGRTGPTWRTHEPVRAHSRKAEEAYAYWRPIWPDEKARRLAAFEAYAGRERRRRRDNDGDWGSKGPLGFAAVALGRLLIRFAAKLTMAGKRLLAPSREYLAAELGVDPRTIDRAKEELRAHGWLRWMRRFEPVESAGGKGPQIRQISNAYQLVMPAAAAILLGFRGLVPPVSADLQSQAEQAAAAGAAARSWERERFAAKLAALPAVQRAEAKFAASREGSNAKDKSPRNQQTKDL